MHRAALILTFGGGTNEVQRDIIGMVAMGLPGTAEQETNMDFTRTEAAQDLLGLVGTIVDAVHPGTSAPAG